MPVSFDPYDEHTQDNPYPIYRRLRDESPVHWDPERGFWTLSRHEDVASAARDHAHFSSAEGIMIGQGGMDEGNDVMPMMIMMDPPRHDELRRLVAHAFTPRAVASMEDSVRVIARELLDALPDGDFDLVSHYAGPLPVTVIAEMLGVPTDRRDDFRQWSDALVRVNPDDPASVERALHGSAELLGFFPPLIEARRREPQDDLISAMVATEADGQRLTDEEICGTAFLLLTAGNETTTNLISSASVVFAHHPDVRRQLVDDPSLIPSAIEEVLRLESPVQGLARTVTENTQLRGANLAAGDQVLLLFGSANRDERQFDRPDEFVLGRDNINRAVAFGYGIHFCLGATLARLEARVAFEELLARAPEYEVGDGLERVHSSLVRGFERLPVRLGKRPTGARAAATTQAGL